MGEEVTLIWKCPTCEREDEVTLSVMDVEVKIAKPAPLYGPDDFKWQQVAAYEIDGFVCAPCEEKE